MKIKKYGKESKLIERKNAIKKMYEENNGEAPDLYIEIQKLKDRISLLEKK